MVEQPAEAVLAKKDDITRWTVTLKQVRGEAASRIAVPECVCECVPCVGVHDWDGSVCVCVCSKGVCVSVLPPPPCST